ncbi:hypothetical protein [Evansella clarkii]|jgi:hypothetical protein|uniref:hypothetical protein n=1 Tax=Evansella clarkii TaxID=79879 RepID=UPI000995FBB1|nr:hypothetical protein [Evansella clarkii]
MINRKFLSAAITWIPATILVAFISPVYDADFSSLVFIYALYIFLFLFTYGVIASFLAEKISEKAAKFQSTLSLMIHLAFGYGFVLPFSVFAPEVLEQGPLNFVTINGLVCSAVFFIVDLMVRRSGKSFSYGKET